MAVNTFIYAPDCPRCQRLALFLERWAAGQLRCLPFSPAALDLHPDLSLARAAQAPQLVLASGYLCEASEAVALCLALKPGFGLLRFFYYLPPFKQLAQVLYWALKARPQGCEACG